MSLDALKRRRQASDPKPKAEADATVSRRARGRAELRADSSAQRVEGAAPPGGADLHAVDTLVEPLPVPAALVPEVEVPLVPAAQATAEELAAAQSAAQVLAASESPEVRATGDAAAQALRRVGRRAPLQIPLVSRPGVSSALRLPAEVPGVLRRDGGRVTFYPADERLMPFDVDPALVGTLPVGTPVTARATAMTRTVERAPGDTVKAQVFTVVRPSAKPRERFVGIADLVGGELYVRDVMAPPRLVPLAGLDPATGRPWEQGAVLEVHLQSGQAAVDRVRAGAGTAVSRAWGVVSDQRLDPSYPTAALREAQAIAQAPLDTSGLVDLRGEPFFAIDNPGSADIDQAMQLSRTPGGGYLFRYALADASHYIRPGMALYDEAVARGSSFYLPRLSVPMLPSELSEGAISLNAGEDHRALVMEARLDAQGNVLTVGLVHALVRSQAQLTYEGVSRELEGGGAIDRDEHGQTVPAVVHDQLRLFQEIGERRLALARQRGVVEPERFEEEVAVANERFYVRDAKSDLASRLNAELSILSNVAGAQLLASSRIPGIRVPGIFRVHPLPDAAQLEALRRQLSAIVDANGFSEDWKWHPGDRLSDYVEYLRTLPATPRERTFSRILQMTTVGINVAALYSREPGTHGGLMVTPYGRFTAPMREMVGVVSHAVLIAKDALEAAFDEARLTPEEAQRLWDYLLLDALVDPAKLPADDRALAKKAHALLLLSGPALGQAAAALAADLAARPAPPPSLLAEIESTMNRVLAVGNGSRERQRQVDSASMRLIFDDLFRSDLALDPAGNPQAPTRTGTLTSVSPSRVHVRLDDPDVELRLSLDDLRGDSPTAHFAFEAEGTALRRDDGQTGPTSYLVVGAPVAVKATFHDGEKLHFAIVG